MQYIMNRFRFIKVREVAGPDGGTVAAVSKEPFRWTDTYVLDITDPKDALYVLMFVLAIDAEKCSRN